MVSSIYVLRERCVDALFSCLFALSECTLFLVSKKIACNYFAVLFFCCTFATRKGVLCPFLTENEINR